MNSIWQDPPTKRDPQRKTNCARRIVPGPVRRDATMEKA